MKKKTLLKPVPPPVVAPQPEQPTTQRVVVFVLTPSETDTVYTALGKQPAEQVEAVRLKLREQNAQQHALLKGLFADPNVQEFISRELPTAEPTELTAVQG